MKLLCILAFALAGAAAAAEPAPYQLDNTEVREIRSRTLQRDYQVFVALPASYRSSQRRYPVVFVTDANYGFPVVRNIAQRLSMHAGLEEAIVVGLSYAQGDSPVQSRQRDYTPSAPRKRDNGIDRQAVYGEARAYGRYIAQEVLPFVGANYRADMGRKLFVGHSYGSLLGLDLVLSAPRTFDHYILGSPSLWFDAGVMFEREQHYAGAQRDLPASLYFGIGALETGGDADMVADLRAFAARLKSRKYRSLTTRLDVFAGEDHASVFPMVATRGLRAYLNKVR